MPDDEIRQTLGAINQNVASLARAVETQGGHIETIRADVTALRVAEAGADARREAMSEHMTRLTAADTEVAAGLTDLRRQMGEQHASIDARLRAVEIGMGRHDGQQTGLQTGLQTGQRVTALQVIGGTAATLATAAVTWAYLIFGKEPPQALLSLINARPPGH